MFDHIGADTFWLIVAFGRVLSNLRFTYLSATFATFIFSRRCIWLAGSSPLTLLFIPYHRLAPFLALSIAFWCVGSRDWLTCFWASRRRHGCRKWSGRQA